MLLRVGSKGEEVKLLQEKLGLKADGSFGPGTEKAVKEWQTKEGLTADGLVGDSTWSKLFPTKKEAPIDITKLKGKVPDLVMEQLPIVIEKFNINTKLRLVHFLSQCSHESGGFKAVSENLNYSADGLQNIFPKYFPGNLEASYARNPEKIANRVYANRMENGDENSGDGYKYRGRGYLQCTGKANYRALSADFGQDFVTNPDLVATKYPLASAAWFFKRNSLWSICDRGSSTEVITALTKRINGGTIGLDHRISEFKKFNDLL